MTKEEITPIVIEVINDTFYFDEDLNLQTQFNEICFDDIDFIEIIMELECKLNCRINDSGILWDEFKTLEEFIDWVLENKE